nr:gjb3.2 [Scophthalmus maximus]
MAALVTGLIPILRTAVDATTTYKCRSLWFGFLCIRVVILFLAELPFTKLDSDFTCNGSRDGICARACFNKHFHKPMMVAWNFMFVLVILSVLLMELFASHLRSLAQKRSSQVKVNVELEGQGQEEAQGVSKEDRDKTVIDLHKDRGTVGFYLLSITLRILVESWFIYVLLFWNLPALENGPYKCSTHICSEKLKLCHKEGVRYTVHCLSSFSMQH